MKKLIIAAAALSAVFVVGIRPHALWLVVHDLCVRDASLTGHAFPCVRVVASAHYAIMKAPFARTHFLLVPTERTRGVEDPGLVAAGAPNYWRYAWAAKDLIEADLHKSLPRDAIGMAINSKYGRTQDQLHIHIDCVRPDVLRTLERNNSDIGAVWSDFPVHLRHLTYRARRIYSASLDSENPFVSLYNGDSVARADMRDETLAVIGLRQPDGQDGFVMLSRHATAHDGFRGYSEDLLDHNCQIANHVWPKAPADAGG